MQNWLQSYCYFITPFVAWLCAGSLKFIINSFKAKYWAFNHIGYGGMPSNHSAIVSSMAALIAMQQGTSNPAFGVAVTVAFIVILDAHSLRRNVGKHAIAINQLQQQFSQSFSQTSHGNDKALSSAPVAQAKLRERMGHSALEIAAGMVVGILVAALVNGFTQI